MKQKIVDIKLNLAIFLGGAGVMIFEIVGSRIIGPYFGTSFIIWTNIIGVILGSLSLGYYLGGKLADRGANIEKLSYIFLITSLLFIFNYIFKDNILRELQSNISSIILNGLISSIILFSPVSIILGIVSPYVAKLKIQSLEKSGSDVGKVYAISTIGSIFGTFFAGFYLIPTIGTNNIILLLAIVFLLISLILNHKNYLNIKKSLFIIIVLLLFVEKQLQLNNNYYGKYDLETMYSRVTIRDGIEYDGKNVKVLFTNNEWSSAMSNEKNNNSLVFDYTKYYDLVSYFNPDFKEALMIGGAGYSYPKYFLEKYSGKKIDVVEIDPGITQIAKNHFNLQDNVNLKIIHEDGRTFLNKNNKKYDVIFGDAFKSQYSLPFHLTTKESYEKMNNSLNDNGLVILNVISAINGEKGEFFRAEYRTIKEVFPEVLVFKPKDRHIESTQNIVIVALKNKLNTKLDSKDKYLKSLLDTKYNGTISLDIPILTDDYAPVDYLTEKSI